jgi:diguanylate cyclase
VRGAAAPARPPGIWYGLAAGLAVFVADDVVYNVYAYALQLEPFPSPADALYLASYPLLAAALLVMIRSRTGGGDRAGLIDALIITTGLGLLSWAFLMRPIAADPSLTLGSRLISLAYPLADVLLLAVLARLVTSPGARSASYRMLGAALLLQTGRRRRLRRADRRGRLLRGLLDLGWMVSYLCWGATARHPSGRSLLEVAPARGVRVSRARLLVLAPAALIAPGAAPLPGHPRPSRPTGPRWGSARWCCSCWSPACRSWSPRCRTRRPSWRRWPTTTP